MLFLPHLGASFLPQVAEEKGKIGTEVDHRRHPALGVHASYSDQPLYSVLDGREATREDLETDPLFLPGTWAAPPGEAAAFLLGKAFDVKVAYSCEAGSAQLDERACSIHQTVSYRDHDGEKETVVAPETLPEMVYQDGKGVTYPLESGSWDWNERAVRRFSLPSVPPDGPQDPPEVPDPPAAPMGRLATPYSIAKASTREQTDGETTEDAYGATLHLYNTEGTEDWDEPLPAELPVVLTFTDLSIPESKQSVCHVSIVSQMTYHAKYGMWSLPVRASASGYITRDGFNAAGSPRLSTEGEWPVDPTFLFVHYRYDEAEYEQIHRARSNHIDDLSVKTTTVPFAGGIGIEAWTTVRPDDPPEPIQFSATVEPVEFFESFSEV